MSAVLRMSNTSHLYLQKTRQCAKRIVHCVLAVTRDAYNIATIGAHSPRHSEAINIDPRTIDNVIQPKPSSRIVGIPITRHQRTSALVCDTKTFQRTPLTETRHYRAVVQRYVDCVPWELTEDYRLLKNAVLEGRYWAGIRSKEQIDERFRTLDQLFEAAQNTGSIPPSTGFHRHSFRAEHEVMISVLHNGELCLTAYFGLHRLSIAKILGLETLCGQIGIVDYRQVARMRQLRHSR